MSAEVTVTVTDRDRVRWIELHRPGSMNGLTPDVNKQMIAALTEVSDGNTEARAVVLTGGGGNFCSGLDLKDAMKRGMTKAEDLQADLREYFHGLIRAVRAQTVPTIAAVDGAAVGFGCDLALAFDIRVASDRARFGEIFVRRGLMPDGGSSFHLSRIVGLGRALELLMTGDVIDAAEALRIGLVTRVTAAAEFHDAVWALAGKLAAGPPLALAHIKRATYAGLRGGLDDALSREEKGQLELLGSADFAEGVGAFLMKRKPEFKGK